MRTTVVAASGPSGLSRGLRNALRDNGEHGFSEPDVGNGEMWPYDVRV